MVTCPHCKGTGRNHDHTFVRRNGCVFCGGSGRVAPAMAVEYEASETPTSPSLRAPDDETIPAPPPSEADE